MDFTEGFERYLYCEASFPVSFFFSIGSWPLGEGSHLSSSPEINLSLEVFLTTKEDKFAQWAGRRGKKREKAGVKSERGTDVRAANTVQGVRGDRNRRVTP